MKAIKNILLLVVLVLTTSLTNELYGQVVVTKKRNGEVRVRKAKRNSARKRTVRVAHYNYRHLPKWGYRTRVVPASARLISYNNIRYRYVNGVFYKPVGRNYVVVAPPLGLRVTVLPVGFRRISVAGSQSPYYYYYGTFYKKRMINGYTKYVVVNAPVGARVLYLPEGYKQERVDNNVYYSFSNCHYKAVHIGGETHYEVVAI